MSVNYCEKSMVVRLCLAFPINFIYLELNIKLNYITMKKIYLFVLSLGLLGTAMAQNSFEDQGMERNMLRLNDNTISAEEVKTDMYGDSRAAFGPFWVNFSILA